MCSCNMMKVPGLAPPRRSQDQRSDMIRGMELWRLMQVAMMEMETAVVMKILCVAACTSEPTPESEDEDENEEDVEETETPEYMVRMKRRSDC